MMRALKRAFDCLAALLGMVILSPFFVLICIAVKCSSPGPVFFRQNRVGRGGKIFKTVKFRTMRVGAESQGSVTTATDIRITPVGRVLRFWKLDELPQLWNVFLGHMSLVGPRPDVQGYADRLEEEERRVLELRPGITGPATLYFRYEEELLSRAPDPQRFNDAVIWPLKVRMNLEYLRTWSFWKDIGYIAITLLPSLNNIMHLIPPPPKTPEELLA